MGDPAKAGIQTFTDLSQTASNVRFIHKLTSFNIMLTWFKAAPALVVFAKHLPQRGRRKDSSVASCRKPFGFEQVSIQARPCNVALAWSEGVKYINVLPYISTFMQTVAMTQQSLSSFIAIFSVVITGFVLACRAQPPR